MVEQRPFKALVLGSSPSLPTNFFKKISKNPLTKPSKRFILKTMKALLKKIKLAIADSKFGQLSNPVYRLKYRPYTDEGNKEVYDYLVSRPFDGWVNGFTAYCFGKGVRRFRFDEIVDREVVHIFGKSVA
jgi:hypothetical protein